MMVENVGLRIREVLAAAVYTSCRGQFVKEAEKEYYRQILLFAESTLRLWYSASLLPR